MDFANAALRISKDFTWEERYQMLLLCVQIDEYNATGSTVFAPIFAQSGQSNLYGSMPARLEVPASMVDRLLNDNETLKGQIATLQSDMSAVQNATKVLQQKAMFSDYNHKKPKITPAASSLPSTTPHPSIFNSLGLPPKSASPKMGSSAFSFVSPFANSSQKAPASNTPPALNATLAPNAPPASNTPPASSAPPASDTIPATVAPPQFFQPPSPFFTPGSIFKP
ncbi:MAG: hypothetical protein Q9209_006077 [Squamulea sp. 1 TL-2023]